MATAIECTASEFITYAAWLSEQRHFISFDDSSDRADWLVVPVTYCPNIATPLDESNWAALTSMLAEADPTGDTYECQRFSSWATPYERYIVAPNSAAHVAAAEAVCALSDYPVLDDSDFSERESEAAFENVVDCVRALTFECQGGEILSTAVAADLYDWFCHNGNWSFLENPIECSVRDSQRDQGLEALGWTLHDDGVYRRLA
jgi:hypothetical protein